MEGRMSDPFEMHEADGMALTVPILPKTPSVVVPVFTGGQAQAIAQKFNGTPIVIAATITGPAEVTCTFLGWALTHGQWTVQVRAAPPNGSFCTILDDVLIVHPSISPP
jgi:hypothetical protein